MDILIQKMEQIKEKNLKTTDNSIPMIDNNIVLIDLDETVYPFLHTWNMWIQENEGQTVDEAFYWYYDLDMYMPGFLEKQADFIEASKLLNPKPIQEASASLDIISKHYNIVAVTARNENEWKDVTETWVVEHLPFVTDIYFTRREHGEVATPKHVFAEKLNAHALIDDTAFWVETLPAHVRGYVVKRPNGFASDAGAVTWEHITSDLTNL